MSAVPLVDVKAHLNITTAANDTELQAMLDTAEAAIAHRVGPLQPTSLTERVRGNTGPLALRQRPVISLTQVTPAYGSDLTLSNLDVDPVTGLIAYAGYYTAFVSYFPMAWYQVTYQAGYQTLPADLVLAVKELTRHLWATQRGGQASPGMGPVDQPGMAYSWPNRVLELIEPYEMVSAG